MLLFSCGWDPAADIYFMLVVLYVVFAGNSCKGARCCFVSIVFIWFSKRLDCWISSQENYIYTTVCMDMSYWHLFYDALVFDSLQNESKKPKEWCHEMLRQGCLCLCLKPEHLPGIVLQIESSDLTVRSNNALHDLILYTVLDVFMASISSYCIFNYCNNRCYCNNRGEWVWQLWLGYSVWQSLFDCHTHLTFLRSIYI